MKDAIQFWEIPGGIVGVSPKAGSTSFVRAYPDASRLDPRRHGAKFAELRSVYYMRNPYTRLVSAYRGFATVDAQSKHRPPDDVMQDFDKFVDYCIKTDNHHWNPIAPLIGFVDGLRPVEQLSELVGERQENKSGSISVFMRHNTMAKIAAYWMKDILIYQSMQVDKAK